MRIWAVCIGIAACAAAAVTATAAAAQLVSEPVTYARDIAPIVAAHCQPCHRPGGDGPFSLASFADVRRRAGTIAAVTRSRFMPPWKPEPGFGDFAGARRLSDSQIGTIAEWAATGMAPGPPPEARLGDGAEGPADSSRAWGDRAPDVVVRLPAYSLRAGGGDVFRIFAVPVPMPAARFVTGVHFRPGNRAVHHANLRVDATAASRRLDEADPLPGYEGLIARSADYPDGHFLGWTPGQLSPVLSDELSWRLNPGSDLVVQLHLRPTGAVEEIAPVIGLYFGDRPPARVPTAIRLGRQDLDIPAGAARHVVSDSFVLPVDVEVRAVQPHAHYRASTVDGWATLPDGSRRPLIRIGDWDMNWQDRYVYASPFWLPAGTRLSVQYTFDNSDGNARNPTHPPAPASWGWRSSDEMADLWLQVMTRTRSDRVRLRRDVDRKMQSEDVVGGEVILKREPNQVNLRNDTAALYLALGQPAKALIHFGAVRRLRPESAPAWFNEGVALEALGRMAEAQAHYAQAIAIDGAYAPAINNQAALWLKAGRIAEARAGFDRAVRADPLNADARANLALVLAGTSATDAALAAVSTALEQKPELLVGMTPIVWLLAAHPEPAARRPDAARRLAESIVAATDRDPAALDALGASLAALGRFEEAITIAGEAETASPAKSPGFRQSIRERIALYRARKAFSLASP